MWYLWYNTFPHSSLYSKFKRKEKRKVNINNNLTILPSHDNKKDWKKKEEVKMNYRKIKEMIP